MVYDEWWLQQNPYWSYGDAHATIDDEFPTAWVTYWGIHSGTAPDHLDPDLWEEVRGLYHLAQRLVTASASLTGSKLPESKRTLPAVLRQEAEAEKRSRLEMLESLRQEVDPTVLNDPRWAVVERYLRWEDGPAGRKERLFRTAVEIHAWALFGTSPNGIGRRSIELLEYLVRCRGLRSREYLSRVANCYILDMRPELAVMSRAVLEAALQDMDELELRVESLRTTKGKRHDSLIDWLDAASEAGALDESGRLAAEAVREAGGAAVHKAPGLAPPAREVLEGLSLALQQLESFGTQ